MSYSHLHYYRTSEGADAFAAAVTGIIRWYQQTLSWDHRWRYVFGGKRVCRYYPSCSDYALAVVCRYGAARGIFLSTKRLLRCTPWSAGGVDDPSQSSV